MYVQLIKGKSKWYWLIKGDNHEKVANSQKYFSKSNAKRAAKKFAKANNWALSES